MERDVGGEMSWGGLSVAETQTAWEVVNFYRFQKFTASYLTCFAETPLELEVLHPDQKGHHSQNSWKKFFK